MTENQNRLEVLLEKFSQSDVSETEFDELCQLIGSENDNAIKEKLVNDLKEAQYSPLDKKKMDKMLRKVLHPEEAPVYEMNKRKAFGWTKIAAAAAIILILGAGVYWYSLRQGQGGKLIANEKPSIQNDVKAPVINKAMITLANGKQIVLDSAGNGTLANEGNVAVKKLADGQIVYSKEAGGASKEITYNILSNPRGSKVISLTLADGSKVWLNAESSLKYPTAFIGNERKVEITGEAYFEVAHNAAMPFKVKKDDAEITVLGTHFNVNAYADEANMKVTLLEGSVRVSTVHPSSSSGQQSIVIKPGEQAIATGNGQLAINKDADLEQVMAWKNGRFQFDGASTEDVMRQIARWYNVDVVYEGKPKEQHFRGGIARNVEASKVFKMLETTGAVHFRIEGNKVVVMP